MRARELMTSFPPYWVSTPERLVSQIMDPKLDENISAVMVLGDDGKAHRAWSQGDLAWRLTARTRRK